MRRIGKPQEQYFAVAPAALLEAKHRKSIGNSRERRYLLRRRGNELFVSNPEVIQKLGSRKRVKRCGQVLGNSEIVARTDESVREVAVFFLNIC